MELPWGGCVINRATPFSFHPSESDVFMAAHFHGLGYWKSLGEGLLSQRHISLSGSLFSYIADLRLRHIVN